LEGDIRKHIPEFEVRSYFEYEEITIKNLLMHRSGLVSDLFNLIFDKTRDYHKVISELRETYLTAKPGKMFSYSNVGYTVLGIIIERVSGLSYTEYIQKEIAKPLGIHVLFLLTRDNLFMFICFAFPTFADLEYPDNFPVDRIPDCDSNMYPVESDRNQDSDLLQEEE